jgi:hypothetical protein
MDHLGIRQFVFFGNCIGGSFALKLKERAPERIVAGALSQRSRRRRSALYQSCGVANVSQLATSPDFRPFMNQRVRCSEEPCVKASGKT